MSFTSCQQILITTAKEKKEEKQKGKETIRKEGKEKGKEKGKGKGEKGNAICTKWSVFTADQDQSTGQPGRLLSILENQQQH